MRGTRTMLKRSEYLRMKRSSEEVQTTGDRSSGSWAQTKRTTLRAAFGLDKHCADAAWKTRSFVTEDREKWQKPQFKKKKKSYWPGHFFSLQERTSSPEPSQGYPCKPVPSHSLKRRCQPESHVLLQRLQWFQLPQLPPPGTGAGQGPWALGIWEPRQTESPTLTWKPWQQHWGHEAAVEFFVVMRWLWWYWLVAWRQPHLMIWWVLNEDQCDWGLGERKKKKFGWF